MEFTHFNDHGQAKMVDVSDKGITDRTAIARGWIQVNQVIMSKIVSKDMKKGDVLSVAQIAGIMGAKRTSELIPMCHNIFLTGADLSFELAEDQNRIYITAEVKTAGQTGVEMEALTAVSIAALAVYDMCKAVDKGMVIGDIQLLEKTGGKSGDYRRKEV